MKNTMALLIFCCALTMASKAQNLVGAWESYHKLDSGEELKTVYIFSEHYQSKTIYNSKTGHFLSTNGGSWTLSNNTLTEKLEFDTEHPENVGTEMNSEISIDNNTFTLGKDKIRFNRIDDGQPGKLGGAWLMSGRVTNGETQLRNTDGPRKTMKILSGTRFQWIAYNTETKQFMGTGGGTYTTINGEYTETIEFFSRDQTRVGAVLKFNYDLIDGHWHHSGLSSKGDPIHEIWSLRN